LNPAKATIRCNNCYRYFIEDYDELGTVEDNYLQLMEDEDGPFMGCPTCQTDEYLMDIERGEGR